MGKLLGGFLFAGATWACGAAGENAGFATEYRVSRMAIGGG
jgi:hypothetical protein